MKKSLSFDQSQNSAACLVALCFESRTKVHQAHLQTTSYAQHKALNEYYDEIVDLTDAYAEAYQGRFGIIQDYPKANIGTKCGIETIKIVRTWIDANRKNCGEYSELQNAIDSIVELCNSSLYKLENLH